MTIKVLICDQLTIVRDGLRTQLEAEPDISVVADTANGMHALMLVRAHTPDVVLTGLNLEGSAGLQMINRLAKDTVDHHPRVAVYAMSDSDTLIDSALRAGVNGILAKEITGAQLISAIRAIAAGQTILAPRVTERLVNWFRRQEPSADQNLGSLLDVLTPRERQILLLVARGMSTEEIAVHLHIGVTTARTHLYRLRNKLSLRDRAQLVSFAYRSGLMQAADTAVPTPAAPFTLPTGPHRLSEPAGSRGRPAAVG